MVFTSKKSAALLVLVSGAPLFSADSNFASVDGEIRKEIPRLQELCQTLHGSLGEWTIKSGNINEVKDMQQKICTQVSEIQISNLRHRDQNDAPALLLVSLYNDTRFTLIAHTLGVLPHVNSMFKLLSTLGFYPAQYRECAKVIKNYITATKLIKEQDDAQNNPHYVNSADVGGCGNVVIPNQIHLLKQAAKQAQSDAVKVIIYELLADQTEGAHKDNSILLQTVALQQENSKLFESNKKLIEEKKALEKELDGERTEVRLLNGAKQTLAAGLDNLSLENELLRSTAAELYKEKVALEKEKAILDETVLQQTLSAFPSNPTKKSGWFNWQ